jgi:hypothetical protein
MGVSVDAVGNIVQIGSFESSADLGCGSMSSHGSTEIFFAKFDPRAVVS